MEEPAQKSMGKKKPTKEVSRLRAQVQLLQEQLNFQSGHGSSRSKPAQTFVGTSQPVSTFGSLTGETLLSLSLADLRKDLSRSLILTFVSLSFIFSLKLAILPNQAFLSHFATNLYQTVRTKLGGQP